MELWFRRPAATLAAAVVALSGCVTVRFDRPVSDLGAAVGDAGDAVGEYLRSIDDFERRLYLDVALYDPSRELATHVSGDPTPLLARAFGPDAIQARVDAVSLLSTYAQRLADLASSDAPGKTTDAAAALGAELASLPERFKALPNDAAAAAYAGPLATVVAAVGNMYAQEQRERALRHAVDQAAPAVDAIVNQLELDLVAASKRVRRSGERVRLDAQIDFYNRHRRALEEDVATRRAVLDDIDRTARRYQALVDFDPTRVTRALRAANAALAKLARSSRTPEDLRSFQSAAEAWGGRLADAAKAARALTASKE